MNDIFTSSNIERRYREIWDESHYKFGAAKDLKHVTWENYKRIKKSEVRFNIIFEWVLIGLFIFALCVSMGMLNKLGGIL